MSHPQTWTQDDIEQRRAFTDMEILPPQQQEDCRLTDQDFLEIQQAAWEAHGLLDFPGFETRVRGCTTDQYVAPVQRTMGQCESR